MGERILIIGANSTLAHETAKIFAQNKASFALVSRNGDRLKSVAKELHQRGAEQIIEIVMDVNESRSYDTMLRQVVSGLGGLDIILFAHGSACDCHSCEENVDFLEREIHTNFTSTVSLLMLVAKLFEQQQKGTIAVISSVAGDRGRKTQYVYASCKSALTVFLQGLRQRLYPSHVAVVTLKLGLVDTPLVSYLKKSQCRRLFSRPEDIAKSIYKAIINKNEEIYLPWFWRPIMIAIKIIPESIFKRMKF